MERHEEEYFGIIGHFYAVGRLQSNEKKKIKYIVKNVSILYFSKQDVPKGFGRKLLEFPHFTRTSLVNYYSITFHFVSKNRQINGCL